MSSAITLTSEPLTAERFALFGDVINLSGGEFIRINNDTCKRYDDLSRIHHIGGEATISIFHAERRKPPFQIQLLERHPLGTQAFIPLAKTRYWIIVAPDKNHCPDWQQICVFEACQQGINFHPGTWHHPLFVVDGAGEFLVVDRVNNDDNCEEVRPNHAITITPNNKL